ncbi:transmembrane protein 184C [Bacillus rossius redtenbacheri]|uniref:transmembrane protein 184C n=1 Tax=Bacillus rossius redtenbacheri TaxID=93214 RepID=UPI002FDD8B98
MCGREILRKWKLWIRVVVMVGYVVIILVLLPLMILKAAQDGFTKEEQVTLIGGLFVMMALPISFWGIVQHIVHYTNPALQKHIIRILWMVPIYALNAWLGLLFPEESIYMDSLRECYEAYVIYNFMVYLLNYLNLTSNHNFEANLEQKEQVKHIFPFCYLSDWEMGRDFVHNCKHGILQYTVVRPVTSFISFICELSGVYGEGLFRGDVAFPYMIAINNFSQFIAMYCLVMFYRANIAELQGIKPLSKFLCIKAVVFFSFFQGVIIAILVYTGVISSVFDTADSATIKDISSKLQDFLICIEMFLAAVAHHFSFSHKPYASGDGAHEQSCCSAFLAMWDVSDVQRDIKEHFGVVGSSLSRHIRGRGMYRYAGGSTNECSKLLVPEPPADPCVAPGYNSAPARLEDAGPPSYYNSMDSSDGQRQFASASSSGALTEAASSVGTARLVDLSDSAETLYKSHEPVST